MLHISKRQSELGIFAYRQLTTHVYFPFLHAGGLGGLLYARRDLGLSSPKESQLSKAACMREWTKEEDQDFSC